MTQLSKNEENIFNHYSVIKNHLVGKERMDLNKCLSAVLFLNEIGIKNEKVTLQFNEFIDTYKEEYKKMLFVINLDNKLVTHTHLTKKVKI